MESTDTDSYRTIEIVSKCKYCCINLYKSVSAKLMYFGIN